MQFWNSFSACAGAWIGWWLAKCGTMTFIIFIFTIGIFGVCLHYQEGTERAIKKAEKLTGIDIIDPKYGFEPGTQVRYKKKCFIRSGPSTRSSKVGIIKPGREYTVLAIQQEWKMIRLEEKPDKIAWVGCKP